MTQSCPFSPLLLDVRLEALVKAVRQEKGKIRLHIRKDEIKLSLFVDDITINLKDPISSENF